MLQQSVPALCLLPRVSFSVCKGVLEFTTAVFALSQKAVEAFEHDTDICVSIDTWNDESWYTVRSLPAASPAS